MQNKKFVFLIFIIALSFQLKAQNDGNSPFSRFGIGNISDDHFMHTASMGGNGSSYIDGFHINIVNPASYASLRNTAFDVGISAKRATLKSSNESFKSWSGNLRYISLAFPIFNPLNEILDRKKRKFNLGMSFTLKPHSSVSYNIESLDSLDGLGEVKRNYIGKGGSYKFLWGNSIKYKDFSFGINLGYLFGKIEYQRQVEFLDLDLPYNNVFSSAYNLRGFYWKIGMMYSLTLNKKALEEKETTAPKLINFGMTFKTKTNFNTNLTSSALAIQRPSVNTTLIDTGYYVKDQLGNGKLPMELGFGVSYYSSNKFLLAADISFTNWAGYTNDADDTLAKNPLSDTYRMSVGGFYRPNYKSYNRYYERVYYRYGFYYGTDPRVENGHQIKKYGLTLGFGLPYIYQRKISHANIGFEIGSMGANSSIKENFFKISLGFTFNDDAWFVKRKYN